jgi:trk system potassium uptake protein TrkA
LLGKPSAVRGDSVVVIGLGRFGTSVARSLVASGHEVLAIDED